MRNVITQIYFTVQYCNFVITPRRCGIDNPGGLYKKSCTYFTSPDLILQSSVLAKGNIVQIWERKLQENDGIRETSCVCPRLRPLTLTPFSWGNWLDLGLVTLPMSRVAMARAKMPGRRFTASRESHRQLPPAPHRHGHRSSRPVPRSYPSRSEPERRSALLPTPQKVSE